MSGTKAGGSKAAATNKEKYGNDFFRLIGQKGGRKGHGGGFASDKVGKDGLTGRERARAVGGKGGRVSKRGQSKLVERVAKAINNTTSSLGNVNIDLYFDNAEMLDVEGVEFIFMEKSVMVVYNSKSKPQYLDVIGLSPEDADKLTEKLEAK